MVALKRPSSGKKQKMEHKGTISERTAAVLCMSIEFIPNASFKASEVECLDIVLEEKTSLAKEVEELRSLPEHLSRLCQAGLLTPAEEQSLFRQMNELKFRASELRAGIDVNTPDPQAIDSIEKMMRSAQEIRDHIIQANIRLVISIVKKYVTPQQCFDEMLSEGIVTLMQSVEKFDFERGFRFSTYAYRAVSRTAYHCVVAAREHEARFVRDAEEWAFEQLDSQQPSTMTDQFWGGLRSLTAFMLKRLDRRERFIIRSRYALGSHRQVRTLQDLANRLGVSKERVRQLEARAVSKLQEMAGEVDLDELRLTTVRT
ncbi:MAG: sigma-70 family RNA polymerase sigma factor [Pirellulaceae bacterium]|nr:sigma-70 family RNA polymerase sigma factor [Pirellulaceae bacterium]